MPAVRSERLALGVLLTAFAALFAGILCVRVSDYDLWWHLALGREIAASAGLAFADSFSYTFAGAAQYSGEWLADLTMFLSYQVLGLPGVYLFKFLLLAPVFWFLYRTCALHGDDEQRRDIALAVLALVVVLFAVRFRLFIRPYLFSYLGVALFALVLNRAQRGRRGLLFRLLAPAMIVWANTSKGAFLGVLLLGLYGIDRLVRRELSRDDLAAFVLVPLASLVNPEGWRVYDFLLGFAGGDQALAVGGEQQPLSLQMLWGAGWTYTVAYQVLVVGAACYLVFLKGWRNLFHLLTVLVFLAFSVALVRMIDFFALLTGPLLFLTLRALVARAPGLRTLGARSWAALGSVVTVALLLLFVPGNPTYAFGVGVKETSFPDGAVAFLKDNAIRGRLFNSYPYGGYLTFFHPEEKVFIDGRGYHLYPTGFQTGYLRAVGERDLWEQLDAQWRFEVALLEYDLLSFGRHFPRHITDDPEWALVFWDGKSAVYLRRTERFADLIARLEYQVARPNFYGFGYLSELLKSRGPALIEALESDVRRNPQNQEVRLAKVFVLYSLNRRLFREEIRRELEVCNSLPPDVAMEFSGLALLHLEDREYTEARRLAEKALSLDPGDPGGKFVMEKLK